MLRKNTFQYDKYLADVLSQEFNLIKNDLKSDKDYIFVFNNIDYDEGEFLNKKNWKQKNNGKALEKNENHQKTKRKHGKPAENNGKQYKT